MGRQRLQTLTERVVGNTAPEWMAELESILGKDPAWSLSDAVDWFGLNRDTITTWLRAYGRTDLLIVLRRGKHPDDWAVLAQQALRETPRPTLDRFAARYGCAPGSIRVALRRAGRADLTEQFRPQSRSQRARSQARLSRWVRLVEVELADGDQTDDQGSVVDRPSLHGFARGHGSGGNTVRRSLINAGRSDLLDRFKSVRRCSQWAEVVEHAFREDPGLTVAGVARQQHVTKQAIRAALIRSGRHDLIDISRGRSRSRCDG
ncbi:hypothetical protein GCM10011575_44070 [Microlunatus endophyticus]|uniref:Uncharacterized protein n=1 Tax=Microlunatus endophyticus TaxID=1716077 RepID=A0A917W836_9ACTN|nr:hypothetical protein [Microlunatus endophyticus]GGL80941.1 hypothetical protein GCM10011575_44070 [Microlunatus endophyticus]